MCTTTPYMNSSKLRAIESPTIPFDDLHIVRAEIALQSQLRKDQPGYEIPACRFELLSELVKQSEKLVDVARTKSLVQFRGELLKLAAELTYQIACIDAGMVEAHKKEELCSITKDTLSKP